MDPMTPGPRSLLKSASPPELSANAVHIWHVPIDCLPIAPERLAACLNEEERHRAARFVREPDRRQFTVSHAALRMILGAYLQCPPECVGLSVAAGGKPVLASPTATPCLHFNLSHSDQLALIAVALDKAVGVDVERIRTLDDMAGLVARYFSPGERIAWQAAPESDRQSAFFRCWTRKEAYLKAQGIGLYGTLERFEVSVALGNPVRLISDDDRPDATTRWQLHDVAVARGYVAACATEPGIEQLVMFDGTPQTVP
jgi:4'-phosphopantetheinyl transferase